MNGFEKEAGLIGKTLKKVKRFSQEFNAHSNLLNGGNAPSTAFASIKHSRKLRDKGLKDMRKLKLEGKNINEDTILGVLRGKLNKDMIRAERSIAGSRGNQAKDTLAKFKKYHGESFK